MVRWVDRWKSFSPEKRYVLLNLGGVGFVSLLQYGVGYTLNLLLGRVLGADEFGIYSTAFMWLLYLTLNIGMAFRPLVLRQGTLYLEQGEIARWTAFFQVVWWRSLLVALLVAGTCLVVFLFFREVFQVEALWRATVLAITCVPVYVLIHAYGSAIQARRQSALAYFLTRALLHVVFLPLVLIGMYWWSLSRGVEAMRLLVVSVWIALAITVIVYLWVFGHHPNPIGFLFRAMRSRERASEGLAWKTIVYFLVLQLITGMLFHLPTLLGGYLLSPEEMGVFNMAFRLLGPVQVPALFIGQVLAPLIPTMYPAQKERLAHMTRRLILVASLVALVLALVLLAFSRYIAMFLRDAPYAQLPLVMGLLFPGGFIVVLTGPAGLFLNLLHRERIHMVATVTGVVVMGVGVVLWGSRWGAPGLALAYTVGIGVYKLLALWMVRRSFSFWLLPGFRG